MSSNLGEKAATSPWSRAALLLILLAGLTLRLWHGSVGLEYGRFWDEIHGLRNVRALLLTGDVGPHHPFYPSPVWSVPQAALLKASELTHDRTGDQRYQVLNAERHPTPTAFRLCRGLMAVYGTLAVLLVFLVGRRMFSARVGLIAALLLAFAPWPVHVSAYIKPDALLLMLTVLAWLASVAAIDRPTVARYVAAGVAIALAMSAKLTGGLVAICLMVATLVLWRERRRWLLLAAAGATSALTFVLLNPAWRQYLEYLEQLKDEYAGHADRAGVTRGAFFSKLADFLTGDYLHGFLIGGLCLAGLVLLAARTWTRRAALGELERARRVMLLIVPLVFPVAYVAQTPHFKANNLLPIAPFITVAGAWLLVVCWQWAEERWPPLRRRWPAALAFLALAAWVAPRGYAYVYRTVTPSTRDAALRLIDERLESRHARLIYAERTDEPNPPWWGRRHYDFKEGLSAVEWVDRLEEVPPERLELSDGVLVDASRLRGPGASFYLALGEGLPPDRLARLAAKPFERRGPAVVYGLFTPRHLPPIIDLDHRACQAQDPSCAGCLELDLPPDPDPRLAYSFYAYFSSSAIGTTRAPPRAELDHKTIELVHASRRPERGDLFLTPRFRLDAATGSVRFCRDQPFGEGQLKIQLFRWAPSR